MPKRNRRRTLIGLAALAFGASGAVASGAFSQGSQGSLGDGWIQVAGTDQTVTFSSLGQINPGGSGGEATDGEGDGGSEGTSGDGENGGDTGGDGTNDDTTGGGTSGDGSAGDDTGGGGSGPSTSVEVLVDPSATNGVNSGGPARWGGSIFKTKHVTGTADGYLRGIRNDEVNANATTKIGILNDDSPGDDVVFIIANVGSEETTSVAPPVTVTMQLLSNSEVLTTSQIQFPYRVLDTDQNTVSSGQDLATAGGIELGTGEIIEVVIMFDTSDGASGLELLSNIQFFATE